jgi:hypothetical protein
MTIDTTFKEFVDENGLNFCVLDFGSRNYRDLVKAFNTVKSSLRAEQEARNNETLRAWAKEQSALENIQSRPAVRTRRGARATPRRLTIAR